MNVEEKETAVDLAVRVEESGGGGVLDWREIGVCWRVAIAELKEWLALSSLLLTHSLFFSVDALREVELKTSGLEMIGRVDGEDCGDGSAGR